MKPSGDRLQIVDVLRGLAALVVLFSHWTTYSQETLGYTVFRVQRDTGHYAVDLFFVISGFVILYSVERSRSVGDFVVSRFARIYPTFFVSLTLVTALEVAFFGDRWWWGGYLSNATMLQEYFGFKNLDVVYWSLTVEITFYAWVAVALALGQVQRLERWCWAWLGVSAAAALAATYAKLELPPLLSRVLIVEHAPFFVIGMAFRRLQSGAERRPMLLMIGAALACDLLIRGMPSLVVGPLCVAIFALALRGWLNWLITGPTLWLGAISYSLYITHRNLGYSVMYLLSHDLGVPVPVSQAVTFCAALALATALWRWVEVPAQRALRDWYARRRTLAVQG